MQDNLNTEDVDYRVAAGQIKTEDVVSDAHNIKKIEAKRTPTVAIDANVLQYF